MEKRWVHTLNSDEQTTENLAKELNIDIALAQILTQRGITTFDAAKNFFRPQLFHLHDPFLMKDMELATSRIRKAIDNQEKILIYGDYDVDGTTAVALAYSFFSELSGAAEYYIPDRYLEGYGISTKGIDYAKDHGFTLIIALDCGIKSNDKVDYASQHGIDFIICDHHLPGENLPKAVAVLDPKRSDCDYPYKELSGCGIGFKLAQAYCQRFHIPEENCLQYLDLAMVSIAADIVPITDENRVLAYYGLKKLNENPSAGLRALMEVSGKTGNYSLTDVVFMLAPRINAAGRIDHASQAVKMLLSQENDAALEHSALINLKNSERKNFDQNITQEALSIIESSEQLIRKKTTVVFNENWHKGVIGIVASRLIEKYHRPTIVLTRSNGYIAGSARSVPGFDLYQALSGCADLLEQFGGHKFAAGLTMPPENIQALADRFEEIVANSIPDELLIPEIKIDAKINLSQIDAKFYRILAQMAPFGPENSSPVFVTQEVFLASAPLVVGTKHLKIQVKQQNSPIFDAIAFNLSSFEKTLKPGIPFSVCYSIEENVWRNKKSLQLNIKAIKTTI